MSNMLDLWTCGSSWSSGWNCKYMVFYFFLSFKNVQRYAWHDKTSSTEKLLSHIFNWTPIKIPNIVVSICFSNWCVYDEDYGKNKEKIWINYMTIILASDNWDHKQSIFLIGKLYTNSMDFKLAINLFKN